MVCKNCACLADIQTGDTKEQSGPLALTNNTHLNGGFWGTGIKCLYPVSCTCQHKPVGKCIRENN